jgi:serine protease Do
MSTIRMLAIVFLATVPLFGFALEPDQLYAKVAPSVVVVVGYNRTKPDNSTLGSGVIIASGQIVTNCHVIKGADVIYLKRDKIYSVASLRFADQERDLCQVTASDKAQFSDSISGVVPVSELRVGQKVYAVGAPQGLELTLSDGLISSLRSIDDLGTVIQTNAPISQGSSGGGLFDVNGRLIGITSFQYKFGQNLNFAVPAGWISELPHRHVEREQSKRSAADIELKEKLRKQKEEEAAQREELKRAEAERKLKIERSEEQRKADVERKEELKRAELETRDLEDDQRKVAREQRRAEAEQKRLEQEKQRQEDQAPRTEATKRAEEQRRADEAKREDESKQRAAAMERERLQRDAARQQRRAEEGKRRAEAAARSDQQKLIDDWRERIQTKIQGRVLVPKNIEGNPEARFEVMLLPGGELLAATLKKSSGNPAYDAAVERAIAAAQPFPVPTDPDLFQANFRELTFVFRPKD